MGIGIGRCEARRVANTFVEAEKIAAVKQHGAVQKPTR